MRTLLWLTILLPAAGLADEGTAPQPDTACVGLGRKMESLADAKESLADLRAKARSTLSEARTQTILRAVPGTNLGAIFDGFERRLQEADDPQLRDEIAGVAGSVQELCRRAVASWSPSPAPPIDSGRLRAILSRPEFDVHDEPVGVLDRIWRWLRKIFLSLLEAPGTAAYAEVGRYVILGLGALGASLVVWRIAVARRSRVPWREPASREEAQGRRTTEAPDVYLARAQEASRAGKHREAVREQMLAVLSTLERRRLTSPGRTQTNREIAADAEARGASAAVASRLASIADWYDRTWYGLASVTGDDVTAFSVQVRDVRAAIEGGR